MIKFINPRTGELCEGEVTKKLDCYPNEIEVKTEGEFFWIRTDEVTEGGETIPRESFIS